MSVNNSCKLTNRNNIFNNAVHVFVMQICGVAEELRARLAAYMRMGWLARQPIPSTV